jgi:stage IV sporulation protein FB
VLGEPSRTQFDLNFTLAGIPVRIHPFFWVAGLLLGPREGGPPVILFWILAFFLGILCHELGHALVMRSQGMLPWITLYGFGGLASSNQPHGFGRGNSDAWRQIFISAAGPLAGFVLAVIAIIFVRLLGCQVFYLVGAPFGLMAYVVDVSGVTHPQLVAFANNLLFVTIVYGILNLLPIYPLDGGQIAREVLVTILGGQGGIRHSLILSLFTATTLALACVLFWKQPWMAVFFGYFAYASYATLVAYTGRGPW